MENSVQEYLKSLSHEELVQMAKENQELHGTGIMPDGVFKAFTSNVSKKFSQPFNISLAESFLYPEIIRRFINKQ